MLLTNYFNFVLDNSSTFFSIRKTYHDFGRTILKYLRMIFEMNEARQ